MNSITELHHKSLEFSDDAIIAKRKGERAIEKVLYEKAYWLEKSAAISMRKNAVIPIPRLAMIKSAAALAFKAGLYQEALKMIAFGYKEYPSYAAEHELHPLFEVIKQRMPEINLQTQYLTGVLTAADAKEYQIKLENTKDNRLYYIIVPSEMMDEIVRSYWKNQVLVEITSYSEGVMILNKISAAA